MVGVERLVLAKFASINFIDIPEIRQDVATLVLMNHFSFNDGPMLHFICRKVIKKEFKVMVLEEQLQQFKLLRNAGCFSINKKSKSLVESLDYAASLLREPKNMLGIFPQGGVFSLHLDKIHFENGLQRILKKKQCDIQVVYAVVLLDFLANFKPKANVYLMNYCGTEESALMEEAFNDFYKSCKKKQQQQYNPPAHVVG